MTEGTSTNGQATSAAVERPRRKRGTGFPVVDLAEAVSIMRKAGQFGGDHKLDAFAGYMGHRTANSGSFKRRIAAFRDWGLIVGGTGDRVVFTDLGRRLAYPTDPDKEKRDLMEAFQNCDIFMRVHDNSAKGMPIGLEALANLAVRQLGVAPVSKDWFAESLTKSAVAAGFGWMEGDKICFVGPSEDGKWPMEREVEDSIQVTDQVRVVAATAHGSGSAEPVVAAVEPADERRITGGLAAGPGMVHRDMVGRDVVIQHTGHSIGEKPALLHQESWEIGRGSLNVEIKLYDSLPAEAFVQLGKVVAEVKKLKEILAEETGSSEPTE
jgi:hypothetical protein